MIPPEATVMARPTASDQLLVTVSSTIRLPCSSAKAIGVALPS